MRLVAEASDIYLDLKTCFNTNVFFLCMNLHYICVAFVLKHSVGLVIWLRKVTDVIK